MNLFRNRRLQIERLESRWVLDNGMTIDFLADTGEVSFENGTQVVTVDPGAVLNVTALASADTPTEVSFFQINFLNSDVQTGQLTLDNWMVSNAWTVSIGSLTPLSGGDILVGGGSFLEDEGGQQRMAVTIRSTPATELGSFDVFTPQVGGDYRLTVAGTSGTNRSGFTDIDPNKTVEENTIEIDHYKDMIIRVENAGPEALDDEYDLAQGGVLTVNGTNGVLANDSDPDGDSLAADLVADVQHGQLDFNDDGSFSYTPISYYFGADSFTYRASDGVNVSNTATVTLTIDALTPWRNPLNPLDVDADGIFKPLDILIVINRINAVGSTVDLPAPGGSFGTTPPYYDVTGDNNLFPNDVLFAINAINAGQTIPDAEGEAGTSNLESSIWESNALLQRRDASGSSSLSMASNSSVAQAVDASLPFHLTISARRDSSIAALEREEAGQVSMESLLDLLASDVAARIH